MYTQTAATNPDAFTNTPAAPTVTTAAPPIGFRDSRGCFWPMALSDARIGAALRAGIDFVAVTKKPATLFDGKGNQRALRVATAIAIACGFDDDDSPGVQINGTLVTPEQFARLLADPATFRAAIEALTLCVTDHFRKA